MLEYVFIDEMIWGCEADSGLPKFPVYLVPEIFKSELTLK